MPLSRPLIATPLTTPTGVRFPLVDRQKTFHCIVTQTALEKLAQRRLTVGDFGQTFLDHRDRIETAASNKYDASPVVYSPFVITPDDLRNPRSHGPAPRAIR